jgi:hypothetical protein
MSRRKLPIPFLLLIAILFIALGDRFLPQPLSGASLNTRNTLNQKIVGLFPSWRPKTKPYERTEKALEQESQSAK